MNRTYFGLFGAGVRARVEVAHFFPTGARKAADILCALRLRPPAYEVIKSLQRALWFPTGFQNSPKPY